MDASTLLDAIADDLSADFPVTRATGFGSPCLKVDGRLFAVLSGEIVLKLPEDARPRALALEGAVLWSPYKTRGPMQAWVQIPAIHADAIRALAGEAVAFVAAGG